MLISNMSRKGAAEKKQTCQKPLYISSVYILVGLSLPLLCVFILFCCCFVYIFLSSFFLTRSSFVCASALFYLLTGGKVLGFFMASLFWETWGVGWLHRGP